MGGALPPLPHLPSLYVREQSTKYFYLQPRALSWGSLLSDPSVRRSHSKVFRFHGHVLGDSCFLEWHSVVKRTSGTSYRKMLPPCKYNGAAQEGHTAYRTAGSSCESKKVKVLLHPMLEVAQTSPVCSSGKGSVWVGMGVGQWWNGTDRGNWSTGRKTLHSVGGRWMNEYGALVEWYWQGSLKYFIWNGTCPSETLSTTNRTLLTCDRTWAEIMLHRYGINSEIKLNSAKNLAWCQLVHNKSLMICTVFDSP
jgi:hypothetical protein